MLGAITNCINEKPALIVIERGANIIDDSVAVLIESHVQNAVVMLELVIEPEITNLSALLYFVAG